MTINGIAMLVAAVFAAIVGVVCYAWGYLDGREKERNAGRRSWSIYGHAPVDGRGGAIRRSADESGQTARNEEAEHEGQRQT